MEEKYNKKVILKMTTKKFTACPVAACPVAACPNFAGFCYKNLWHWVVLVAAIPFVVAGVKYLLGDNTQG